MTSDRKH